MSLHLGKIEDGIALNGSGGDGVFVMSVAVMTIDCAGIVVSTVVVAGAVMISKLTVSAQVKNGGPFRVTREFVPLDDDLVPHIPSLSPKVKYFEGEPVVAVEISDRG